MERICRYIGWIVFCLMALQVQAGRRRVVDCPGFVAANTAAIEFRRIVLTGEQTQVDAVMYGKPGTPAVISSKAALRWSGGGTAFLRDAGHVSIDGLTEPEMFGKDATLEVTLSFPPIPPEVHEVDFVEPELGWDIAGLQLSREEPYVYVPDFLIAGRPERKDEIPEPGLSVGRAVVNGYILGYDTRLPLCAALVYEDGLFPKAWKQSVKVRQDGSFHLEVELLQPTLAALQLNVSSLKLFLVPGEELTVYIHLPRLSMSGSRVWKKRCGKRRKAWFDGAAETINGELERSSFSPALQAYRAVARALMEKPETALQWKSDRERVMPVCERLAASFSLSSNDRKVLKTVGLPEVRAYVEAVAEVLLRNAGGERSQTRVVAASLDTLARGADIMAGILSPHKGKAILVDFWATWCSPCRKSRKPMAVLKRSLPSEDIIYVYLTGPSSPEDVWRAELSKMPGVHYRLTASQWKYLCEVYGVTGIPAYLIFSHEGRLLERYVGFPGTEALQKDLLRALKE